mgnify:CR=1 FL=1
MIAIFGRSTDDLVREVCRRLAAYDKSMITLVDQDAPSIVFYGEDFWNSQIDRNGSRLSDVGFVWNRTKLAPMARPTDPFPTLRPNEYRVRMNEWRAIVTAIAVEFGHSTFNPEHIRLCAEQKLVQQSMAKRSGFKTLPSIVATSKACAMTFAREHGRLVAKALGAPVVASRATEGQTGGTDFSMLSTTSIDLGMLESAPDSQFELIPVWLQKRIRDGEELRVIAFGGHVFAYQAPYSFSERKMTDIRFADFRYAPISCSDFDASPILTYLQVSGLDYGVFDLCLTSEGDLTFLECNPEGMWHSINGTGTEEKILDRFTDHLLATARLRART